MACVTAQLIGPAKRMDALLALFRYREGSGDLCKSLKSFQGRLQQLGEDRNRVVHDPLCVKIETGEVHKLLTTAKGELKFSFEPVSKDKMARVSDDIQNAIQEFIAFKKRIDREMDVKSQEELERIDEFLVDRSLPNGTP